MSKAKDNLEKVREAGKKLNARLDPKVDSALQRVINSPYTPLFALVALIIGAVLYFL